MSTISRVSAICLFALCTVACVDLDPARLPAVRWIDVDTRLDTSAADLGDPTEPFLRIGTVLSDDALGEALMRRRSPYEVRYDEDVRWVVLPAAAVENAIEHELYRRRGFVRDASAARTLEVRVVQFEEVASPRREAVVGFVATLTGPEGRALLDQRFEARRPIGGDDPVTVAEAMSGALASAVSELADVLSVQ